MEMQTVWADRNQSREVAAETGAAGRFTLLAASRGGCVALQGGATSFWVAVRGGVELESREGRFRLGAGEWIALEPESRPNVFADRDGLALGIAMNQAAQLRVRYQACLDMQAGRGRLAPGDARRCVRLWRQAGTFGRGERHAPVKEAALPMLLRYIGASQRGLQALVERCPGRSQRRKRQVFGRLQRARLYLEGNADRNVRLAELAELSNVSIWYFTKIFHALYGESPQAMAARLRLERAAGLLADSTLSVGEVGVVCGFENNCSFSRAFRERYGRPPSAYRSERRAVATNRANQGDTAGKAQPAFAT
jgi:AraC family transcriptional regulator